MYTPAKVKSGMFSGSRTDAVNKVGSAIEILPVVPQLLLSVTETVYVPELKLVAVSVVCTFESSHK